jgi:hypothetical protein
MAIGIETAKELARNDAQHAIATIGARMLHESESLDIAIDHAVAAGLTDPDEIETAMYVSEFERTIEVERASREKLADRGFDFGCGAGGPEWSRELNGLLVIVTNEGDQWVAGIYVPEGTAVTFVFDSLDALLASYGEQS